LNVIYTVLLHQSCWTTITEKVTLQGLNHQVGRTLQNQFQRFFHNSFVELAQVELVIEKEKLLPSDVYVFF